MRSPIALLLLGCVALAGCRGCERERRRGGGEEQARAPGCTSAAQCDDGEPCTLERCEEGECVRTLADRGANCDDGDRCNGVAVCDERGRCVAGKAPEIDDQNPCTIDSCDRVRGVSHEPIPIDDHDPCTEDACDPATGSITHRTLPLDDGDACTVDRCDPARGVVHERPNPFYTCDVGCGAGFHAALRRANPKCGSPSAPETYCAPACEPSFYTCDANCPAGYHPGATLTASECGDAPRTFCTQNGDSFYSCAARCPEGYEKRGETPGRDCGARGATRSFCVKR